MGSPSEPMRRDGLNPCCAGTTSALEDSELPVACRGFRMWARMCIALVGWVPLLLLSCSHQATDEDTHGTLRVGCCIPERLEGLDPISGPSATSPLVGLIFNGLVQVDATLMVVPDLAESWETSEDGLTWTFHLRKGVRFHDGVECTAQDAKFSLDLVRDPKAGSHLLPALRQVEDVSVVDTHTLGIMLKEPHAPLLVSLTAPVLPKHLLDGQSQPNARFNLHPIGTGPFGLPEWGTGDRLVFEANERYFRGRPKLGRIVVTTYLELRPLWVSLLKGDVDVASRLAPELLASVESDPRFRTYAANFSFCYSLLWNLRSPLFSDRRVREAMAYALDRSQIIESALAGRGVPATGPFAPGTWPCDPHIAPTQYDPDRALQLLRQAGWHDRDADGVLEKAAEPLEFSLLIDRGDITKQMAAGAVRLQLDEIGVRMKVEELACSTLMERVRSGAFDACLAQMNPGLDPDAASLGWSSTGAFNFGSYSNKQVDALLGLGRALSSHEKRQEVYHNIHALIVEDHPAAFLFYMGACVGCSSRLTGTANISATDLFYGVEDWWLSEQRGGDSL